MAIHSARMAGRGPNQTNDDVREIVGRNSNDLSPRGALRFNGQSTCKPPEMIAPSQRFTSSATNLARYSGERRSGATLVTPLSCILALTAGVSIAACVAALSLATTSAGAPLGRKNADHVVTSRPASPCSWALARSGISGERPFDSTAMALTCLLLINGAAAPMLPHR